MWIVDSSIWIDYFNGTITPKTDLLDAALGERNIAICDIILCEVLQGFHRDQDFNAAQQALLQFPIFPLAGTEIAIKSANNFRYLRRNGITGRKTIDCLIATFVIERDFSLLHNDRDFDYFEEHLGLKIVSPQTAE